MKYNKLFFAGINTKKHQELADLGFYLDCKEAKDEHEFLSKQKQRRLLPA